MVDEARFAAVPTAAVGNRLTGRYLVIIGGLLVASIVALILWRGRPGDKLTLYTAQPTGSGGARLRMLVPRGWTSKVIVNAQGAAVGVEFKPSLGPKFLPDWLRRLFTIADVADAWMIVVVSDGPGRKVRSRNEETRLFNVKPDGTHIYNASRVVFSPDGRRSMLWDYYRANKPAFDKTYKAIADSLQVE
jgi:hypothetical protein